MLLTIHNLPMEMGYMEVKNLIRDKSGISNIIVDNLVSDVGGKQVTVGLADEGDAVQLMQALSGEYVNGYQLYVEDNRKKPRIRSQPFFSSHQEPEPPVSANRYEGTVGYPPPLMSSTAYPQNLGQTQTVGLQHNVGASDFGFNNNSRPTSTRDTSTWNYASANLGNNSGPDSYKIRGQGMPTRDDFGRDDRRANDISERVSRFERPDDLFRSTPRQIFEQDHRGGQGNSNPPLKQFTGQSERFEYTSNQERDRVPDWQPAKPSRWEESTTSLAFNSSFQNIKRRSPSPKDQFGGRQSFRKSRSPVGKNVPFQSNINPWSSQGRSQSPVGRPSDRVWVDNNSAKSLNPWNTKQIGNSLSHEKPNPRSNYERAQLRKKEGPAAYPKHFEGGPSGLRFPSQQQVPPPLMQSGHRQPNYTSRVGFNSGPTPMKRKFEAKDEPSEPPSKKHPFFPDENNRRSCATNTILRTMVGLKSPNNGLPGLDNKLVLKVLKINIRNRIEKVLGDECNLEIGFIVSKYRKKYTENTDKCLLMSLIKKAERNELFVPVALQTNTVTRGPATVAKPAAPKFKLEPKPPKPAPPLQLAALPKRAATAYVKRVSKAAPVRTPGGKLPRYINDDRDQFKQLKQIRKQEVSSNPYMLPPAQQVVLDQELRDITKLMVDVCKEKPASEVDTTVAKIIGAKAIPEIKEAIQLNVAKRILDIRTNLSVRVFFTPRLPPRGKLDEFLFQYGVLSGKKSYNKKMYVATCDTYDNYDRLVALGSTVIDGMTLTFKPFLLTAPKLPPWKREKLGNTTPSSCQIPLDDEIAQMNAEAEMDIGEFTILDELDEDDVSDDHNNDGDVKQDGGEEQDGDDKQVGGDTQNGGDTQDGDEANENDDIDEEQDIDNINEDDLEDY